METAYALPLWELLLAILLPIAVCLLGLYIFNKKIDAFITSVNGTVQEIGLPMRKITDFRPGTQLYIHVADQSRNLIIAEEFYDFHARFGTKRPPKNFRLLDYEKFSELKKDRFYAVEFFPNEGPYKLCEVAIFISANESFG